MVLESAVVHVALKLLSSLFFCYKLSIIVYSQLRFIVTSREYRTSNVRPSSKGTDRIGKKLRNEMMSIRRSLPPLLRSINTTSPGAPDWSSAANE